MTPDRPTPADLVVDTSAIIGILLGDAAKTMLAQIIASARGPLMSAGSVIEVLMVAEGRAGSAGVVEAQRLIDQAGILVMPVDGRTTLEAYRAWQRFGKGNHPAALNYGDCFTYALAARTELPVLCVRGHDFARTETRGDLCLSDSRSSTSRSWLSRTRCEPKYPRCSMPWQADRAAAIATVALHERVGEFWMWLKESR